MSAAGGASDYVWVGTADGEDWMKASLRPGDHVADIIAQASQALVLGRARLYVVAKGAGEQKPTQAAIAEALSLGHLAPEAAWASTGVASGGWLVAAPKAPAGSDANGDIYLAVAALSAAFQSLRAEVAAVRRAQEAADEVSYASPTGRQYED